MKYHEPVMLKECLHWLDIKPDGNYVDATFGGGGHSRAILGALEHGRLMAFDKDEDASVNEIQDGRFTLVQSDFRFADRYLRLHRFGSADGILADLGISSHQIDVPSRGFSTRSQGPLDLRMDKNSPISAAEILSNTDESDLIMAFRDLGGIPNSRKLVTLIKAALPIATTTDLIDAIKPCTPKHEPSKYLAKVFQALRILVNDELGALRDLLDKAPSILKPGGRMVVLTYHSVEDRMVKNHFRSGNADGKEEKDFFGNKLSPWKVLTSKAIVPSEEELKQNNRARSAKLRVAEKI